MLNPCSTLLELLGMIVGLVAWLCSLACTLLPSWLIRSTELLVAERQEKGLWESCVVHEEAGSECRPYETLLGLPHNLTMARICMCMSDAIAILGLLIAAPGLSLVKSCEGSQELRVKRGVKITAGLLVLMAGIITLYSVSTVAHDVVLKFHDHSLPHSVPRWEFGDAMFIGWVAGFFNVVSAALFFASCCGSEEQEMHLVYHHKEKIQPLKNSSSRVVEYV